MRVAVIAVAAVAAAAVVVSGQESEPRRPYQRVTDERLRSPDPQDWLMYRRTYDGLGFSPLRQIHTANVADLVPAWQFENDTYDGGSPQAPPIVNGGTMFVATADQVVALDAATGALLWRHAHQFPEDTPRVHSTNRGVALYSDLVYVGTLDARVVALDAITGSLVWERSIADYRTKHYITMAPLVINGRVLVGTSGGEHGVRGFIVALDAATGEEVWRFYTIPGPGEFGSETWPQGDGWRHGGGAVWVTGTYDPDLGLTYWGVGNGGPWTGDARPGDNLFTTSTVALNPDTGELVGYHQYHWNGSWDWDEVVAPLLVDLDLGGRSIPTLVHPGRNGYLWLLARAPSGIRFLDAWPFVYHNVFTGIDPFTGRPSYDPERTPRIGYRTLFCPAIGGGRNWRPESFSPRTGLLYVPAINNRCSIMEGRPVEYVAGKPFHGARLEKFDGSNSFTRDGARHVGELQAWDLGARRRTWTREFPTRVGSVLSTAGDVLFVEAPDLRAFDALSGDELWVFDLGERGGPPGVPMTYAVDGVQYLALQARARAGSGSVVMAFSLDCQC